jgi:hypothetical protein
MAEDKIGDITREEMLELLKNMLKAKEEANTYYGFEMYKNDPKRDPKKGYFLGGILSALAGKALLPKILGGIAGGLVLNKLFGSKKSGTSNESVEEALARFNTEPETKNPLKNLYKSKYTDPETGVAPQFDTEEEKEAYELAFERRYGGQPVVAKPYTLTAATGGMMESGIGGLIQGPGNVTSDSIPGGIMQNGNKVEEILVSNGEVILSGKDLAGLDPDGNMERAGMRLGNAPNGTRGAEAARMFAEVNKA